MTGDRPSRWPFGTAALVLGVAVAMVLAGLLGPAPSAPGTASDAEELSRSRITGPSNAAAAGIVDPAGRDFARVEYALEPGRDPDLLLDTRPPSDWTAPRMPIDDLDPHLPHPWPEKYRDGFEQPFTPHVFMKNAAALCQWLEAHPEDRGPVERLSELLVERLGEYLEPGQGGQLVVYRFDHAYRSAVLDAPWPSAYGNARAIMGTLVLSRCLGVEAYQQLAYDLAAPLRPSEASDATMPPVAFVTPEGFLWFEEAPLVDDPAPMVLNGHISTVFALYYLQEWGDDPDAGALELAQAGLASVKRYAESFQRPGETNRYDLLDPPVADYGPERTVRQQRALFELTGDPFFAEMADRFAADAQVAEG